MPIALRTDFDAASVRRAARQSKEAGQVRRLLALVAIYDGANQTAAAGIGGVDAANCPRLGGEVQCQRPRGSDRPLWFGDEARMHGVDEQERPVLRGDLRRAQFGAFFTKQAPTTVALEACGGSHHLAPLLSGLGHRVVLVPPQYVKPLRQAREE